jgi:NAD-dependent SIR2 family protein deacetylase
LPNLKGRDLFDAMIWGDAFTTSVFYMFISSLRQKVLDVVHTTETHKFLRTLRDGGRLVRVYTQNIDMLEEREGLSGDLTHGPGTSNRSSKTKNKSGVGSSVDLSRGCEVVPLHGTLARLRCSICCKHADWDCEERKGATLSGTAPDCPFCAETNAKRTGNGRRGVAVGRLRPDIVLYGEEHPHDHLIHPLVTNDLGLSLDVLLIMGTSLKVHGLKVLVKEFAKAIHARGGTVVFINRTKPSESTWGDVIDYWVEMDCDEWVLDLKVRRRDIWLPAGSVEEAPVRKTSTGDTKDLPKKRPQALRDDKVNGAFVTFKILDTLGKFPDSKGQSSARRPYWQLATRYSSASMVEVTPVTKPPAKKRVRKSVPSSTKALMTSATTIPSPAKAKIELPKRQSLPLDLGKKQNNQAYMVSNMWEELRKKAPGLPAVPPELRQPFAELPTNLPSYLTPFDFGASNHFPNLGGKKEWPLEKMNMDLIHLPPKGLSIPMHTPKNPKTATSKAANHSYGTRASGRLSTTDTIVMNSARTAVTTTEPLDNDTIIVDDPPLTPCSSRIKRLSSIGNLVESSPEEGEEIWHDAPEVMT